MKIVALLLTIMTGCGPSISEIRMMPAPPREVTCALELVQVDTASMAFHQTWDLLGMITLQDATIQDPAAESNRALVRPRACSMGATSIAVALNGATTNQIGQQGSTLMYMALRPKAALAAPTAF